MIVCWTEFIRSNCPKSLDINSNVLATMVNADSDAAKLHGSYYEFKKKKRNDGNNHMNRIAINS